MDSKKKIKAWQEVKISKRFLNAFRGMYVFIKPQDIFMYLFLAIAVIIFDFILKFQVLNGLF